MSRNLHHSIDERDKRLSQLMDGELKLERGE